MACVTGKACVGWCTVGRDHEGLPCWYHPQHCVVANIALRETREMRRRRVSA